jgi:hypothetical protein
LNKTLLQSGNCQKAHRDPGFQRSKEWRLPQVLAVPDQSGRNEARNKRFELCLYCSEGVARSDVTCSVVTFATDMLVLTVEIPFIA